MKQEMKFASGRKSIWGNCDLPPMFLARPSWNSFLAFLLPLIVVSIVSHQRLFSAQELLAYDFFLKMRPAQQVSSDIAIIEIDDATLGQLGQWPLPRDFHASLVDVLKQLGAKAIIFDLIFSEPTAHDMVFAQSMRNNGNVYLPQVFYISPLGDVPKLQGQAAEVLAPITGELEKAVIAKGHINVFIDPDGKTRRAPLFIKDQGGMISQIGLQVACDQMGLDCGKLERHDDRVVVDGKLFIPVLRSNEILVNYPGLWQTTFKHFSYLGILSQYQKLVAGQGEIGTLADLNGKICFIGLTAAGTVDLKPSPLENSYPMTGVMASIYNSAVLGQFLRQASSHWQLAYLALLYVLCLWVCLGPRPLFSFLGSSLLVLISCLISGAFLMYGGVWVDVFLPAMFMALVYVFCALWRWSNERRQLEFLEKEMMIAQKIQAQFLQGPKEEEHDLDLALWFNPAKYVAGDFYDVFKVGEGRSGIFIGDVSGKGLSAALCMAQTISLFRIFSRKEPSLKVSLERLNQELCLRNMDRFATALYCVVDVQQKSMTVASAGHGLVYIYRAKQGNFEELDLGPNTPLGVMPDSVYNSLTVNIEKKDKLVLFSDGINEARSIGAQEIGIAKIKEYVAANATRSNEEVMGGLKAMLAIHMAGADQHDDMTLIIASIM